ncbi:endonuclease domain-containing protein [Geomonas subterranea]|uniref:Endonuclease domain-containing protein n=1 Tax=Geomonas subterranea TaxID=2847989 RepID=A0ABX8LPZ2_9BACT|nr:endonuclease domain-containing protein [Geomonas subterranea]QXE92318.1 endonuclease domain-containing protein [Geomonas subterranea]QXM09583.1 endonuclease domain-containing protein [Geomonas subterranea]
MPQATYSKLPEGLRDFARSLRGNQTDAENLLWLLLRNRRLGFKFRRQHPVAGYILDFFCHEAGLCVELDGGEHNAPEAAASDEQRTKKLNTLGITVLRFWDDEVLTNTEVVLEKIYLELVK